MGRKERNNSTEGRLTEGKEKITVIIIIVTRIIILTIRRRN
jgi:hypothetical protein